MPTYDYRCDACQHQFEEFQSFSDKVLKKCPACGKRKLRRLLGTGAAVIFKGSGFYQTDYRSSSYAQAAKAEESQGGAASKGDAADKADKSAKSDTGAAAKKEDTAGSSGNSGKSDGKTGAKSAKSGN